MARPDPARQIPRMMRVALGLVLLPLSGSVDVVTGLTPSHETPFAPSWPKPEAFNEALARRLDVDAFLVANVQVFDMAGDRASRDGSDAERLRDDVKNALGTEARSTARLLGLSAWREDDGHIGFGAVTTENAGFRWLTASSWVPVEGDPLHAQPGQRIVLAGGPKVAILDVTEAGPAQPLSASLRSDWAYARTLIGFSPAGCVGTFCPVYDGSPHTRCGTCAAGLKLAHLEQVRDVCFKRRQLQCFLQRTFNDEEDRLVAMVGGSRYASRLLRPRISRAELDDAGIDPVRFIRGLTWETNVDGESAPTPLETLVPLWRDVVPGGPALLDTLIADPSVDALNRHRLRAIRAELKGTAHSVPGFVDE